MISVLMIARLVCILLISAAAGAAPAQAPATAAAPRLQLHKWSGNINVPDPVACTVDPQGRVYVTQTTRRKVADLDIREHTMWIPNDVALESIEQKKAFYRDVLAPGKTLRPRGGLKDHNGDGSIDWKDLTVHTERIYRMEDTDGDGTADKMTVFAEGFNTEVTGIAAGILWHDGWIYCTIAPDLWRLRDTNDDGVADEREVVAHGFGHHIAYAGHDMHGLCVGPDGRIYWTIGDKGVNVTTKEGRHVAKPHEGAVLRCEPDGSNFEIFAHGLRNVQEVAFDEFGNLFGIDNDADKPGEKERFVYITEQSDSGWRCSYQYMKGWIPWVEEGLWQPRFSGQPLYITPPLAAGHDGPAGFLYHPGTALGKSWKGSFFGTQFPSGKINAFRLAASGASFTVEQDELVSSGVMGIGMSWGPDGKIYMADWGGDYPLNEIGAVWTVDDPAGVESPDRQETARRLREGFSNREAVEPLALLGDEDQRVRQAAQFEVVKRGEFARLQEMATNGNQSLLARVHALWGLGQGMRSGKVGPEVVGALLDALVQDKEAEIRAQLAKVIGDAIANKPLAARLRPLLGDASLRVRFHAAIALGKLQSPEATEELVARIAEYGNKDAYLRHALVTGLAGCATSKELGDLAAHESTAVRLAAVLAMRRKMDEGVRRGLEDTDDGVVSEVARAIHDDESITTVLPDLAAALASKRAWPEAFVRRSLNANFRVGGAAEAERVMQYALRADVSDSLREEALTLLKLWSMPPPLDRVDGRARPLGTRPEELVAKVVRPHLDELLKLENPALKTLAVHILTAYKLPVEARLAAAFVAEASAPEEVRVEALHLLMAQHAESPEVEPLLEALLGDSRTPALRMTALELLGKRAPDKAVTHAEKLISSGSTVEKQQTLGLLAAMKTDAADAVLLKEMEQLLAGECPPSRQLDVLEAVQMRAGEVAALKEKFDTFEAPRVAMVGTAGAFTECLEGGDWKLGKEIALEHLAANCTACHRFDSKEGSNVGPLLSTIGAQKDRQYLLESLVAPTMHIAPGFGMVSVTLKDGKSFAGVIAAETPEMMELRLADGAVRKIATTDITVKTPPMSVMPPMSAILTKRQIRDVVAYLAGLKGSQKKAEPTAAPVKKAEAQKKLTTETKKKGSTPKKKKK